MIESGRGPGKGRISASTENMSERVPKNDRIRVSTGKKMNLGEYQEKVEFVRVPKNCPNEYGKRIESGSVPKNNRIRASTGKMYNPDRKSVV